MPGGGSLGCAAARATVPAIIAVELVLTAVGLLGVAQDVFDQPAIGPVLIHRCVRLDLRPIDRDHPDRHQARLPTQTKDLVKQPGDLRFMAAAELRDRGVVRAAHPRDHLERHVLPTRPLDPPRGPNPTRVRIEQQRHHHRRIERRAPRRAQPIPLSETAEVHLIHSTEHRPDQMILRQPLDQRRRHQQQLTTVNPSEFSSHARSLLNPPDSTDIPTASRPSIGGSAGIGAAADDRGRAASSARVEFPAAGEQEGSVIGAACVLLSPRHGCCTPPNDEAGPAGTMSRRRAHRL